MDVDPKIMEGVTAKLLDMMIEQCGSLPAPNQPYKTWYDGERMRVEKIDPYLYSLPHAIKHALDQTP